MLVLLLSTLLNSSPVQAGFQLSKCVDRHTNPNGCSDLYDAIASFVNNNNLDNGQKFCCDSFTSRLRKNCTLRTSGERELGFDNIEGQCSKIGHSIFCVATSYDFGPLSQTPRSLLSKICGGILGDTSQPVKKTTIGTCPKPEIVGKILNETGTVPQIFSWLCCDNNGCTVPYNVIADSTFTKSANTSCDNDQHSLMCFGDDGTWTCTGHKVKNTNQSLVLGSCLLQLPKPSVMEINAGALPTPWPIGAINAVISIVSIFTFQMEESSFNWFAILLLTYDLLSILIELFFSINSLRTGGLENFEYSSTALSATLVLPPLMLAVKRGLNMLKNEIALEEETFDLQDFSFSLNNLSTDELIERSPGLREKKKQIKRLGKIYSLRYLCWGLVIFSFCWQIFAITVYSSNKNFSVSSPLVTNCEREVSGVNIKCDKNNLYRCFIKGQGDFDFIKRILSLFPFVFLLLTTCLSKGIERQKGTSGVKAFFRGVFWMISFYLIMYLVMDAVFQSQGFRNVSLSFGSCDINPALLSSKTGYLMEWITAKQYLPWN